MLSLHILYTIYIIYTHYTILHYTTLYTLYTLYRKYTRREPVQNLDHLKKSKNGEGGGGNNINMTEELDINESANILLGFCGVGAPAFPSLATGSGDAFPSSSSQDPTSSHYTYSVLNGE